MNKIIIHSELYSTKNSKQILGRGKKKFIAKSFKAMANQKDLCTLLMCEYPKWIKPIQYPIYVHLKVYRKTHRRFDYVNIVQGLLDAMTQTGYFPDDDSKHIIPVFHQYEKDADDPRTEIWWTEIDL